MTKEEGEEESLLSHLDRLLADKPPEFKAKVLRFALDSGMKPNDPAFRLVQYIGYLAQLTETAPDQWKELFENLEEELNEWRKATISQLGVVADNSQEIKHLATNCDRLGTTLSALDLTSKQQIEQMKALAELLMKSNSDGLKKEMPALTQKLNQFEKNQELITHAILKINKQIEKNVQSTQNPLKKISNALAGDWDVKQWVSSILIALVLWFLTVLWVWSVFFIFPPPLPRHAAEVIQNIDQQVNYNYTKLSRVEKALGTDPHQKEK